MTKAELRKSYLAQRQSLSPAEREEMSRAIVDGFFGTFDMGAVRFLHCFISIEKFNEIDTALIFDRVWNEYPLVQTAVPRVNYQTGEMESLAYGPETPMRADRWGISEPDHDEFVEPGKIDIVIVPLLCFDRSGHRVGYGKGYYDRFLARCRPDCRKIGVSYFDPVDRIDDAHQADIRLDYCVTPTSLYRGWEQNADLAGLQ